MMSQVHDKCEDETVEHRLRMLGDMPSSSSEFNSLGVTPA